MSERSCKSNDSSSLTGLIGLNITRLPVNAQAQS
jgi:hypothetical protein